MAAVRQAAPGRLGKPPRARRQVRGGGAAGTVLLVAMVLATLSCTAGVPLASVEAGPPRGWPLARRFPRIEPSASLAGRLDGESEDEEADDGDASDVFSSGLGLRVGVVTYPSTTSHDVASRAAVTIYYHFKETESRRLESALSYFGSQRDPGDNHYVVARLKYVGYLGEAGLVSWSVGGGALFEKRYYEEGAFGYVGLSVGYWLSFGQRGLDLRLTAGMPLGSDLNVLRLLAFTVGCDF